MSEEDVRYVVLTGKEHKKSCPDGHVRIDVCCPFHGGIDASCWVHFGLDGHGRFYCRPCSRIGTAEYSEDNGQRLVSLSFEGEYREMDWVH